MYAFGVFYGRPGVGRFVVGRRCSLPPFVMILLLSAVGRRRFPRPKSNPEEATVGCLLGDITCVNETLFGPQEIVACFLGTLVKTNPVLYSLALEVAIYNE